VPEKTAAFPQESPMSDVGETVRTGTRGSLRSIARRILPRRTRRHIAQWGRRLSLDPAVGGVDLGDFRRLAPISDDWGFDRGEPIDRYYIRDFMEQRRSLVRGRVLEIASDEMTRAYGDGRVDRSDVLHVSDAGPHVTIVADLASGEGIPASSFDCVIVTQTLQLIYDVRAAIRTIRRILRPGGVALVTVPAITRISRQDMDRWGQYWCFTSRSARALVSEVFRQEDVEVQAYGNVLAACSFLQGLAAEELQAAELLHRDPDFETLIGVRATRSPV
jgi:SAM-dependent methyltransferase